MNCKVCGIPARDCWARMLASNLTKVGFETTYSDMLAAEHDTD